MAETSDISVNQCQPKALFHDLDEVNHAISGSNLELVQLKSGKLDIALEQMLLGDLDPGRFSIAAFASGAQATGFEVQWNENVR